MKNRLVAPKLGLVCKPSSNARVPSGQVLCSLPHRREESGPFRSRQDGCGVFAARRGAREQNALLLPAEGPCRRRPGLTLGLACVEATAAEIERE